MRGADPVAKLERSLANLRALTETERVARAEQAGLAERAERAKRASATDPEGFATAAEAVRVHLEEVERLELVLEQRDREITAAERALEHARYEVAREALADAYGRRRDAAGKLSKALAAATGAMAVVTVARSEVEAAEAAANELRPVDVDIELAASMDEPAFPARVEQLVELLQAGPRRPYALQERRVSDLHEQQTASALSEVRQAVRELLADDRLVRCEAFGPGQRAAALARAEQEARTMIFTSDRERVAIARRVDRLRQLVHSEPVDEPVVELEPAAAEAAGS